MSTPDNIALSTQSARSRRLTRFSWMNAVLLFSIAIGPVGTFVQLYLLELHGTVVDVSLAVTIYNLVSIPSVMLWGFITDRFHRRRPMIVASFLSTSFILLSFSVAGTAYSVVLLYTLLSLTTSASTASLNLLILETEKRDRWATAFAKFSLFTSAGQVLGVFLGVAWSLFLPLRQLVVPLTILSLTSTCLALLLVKEPPITFERRVIVMNQYSLLERLKVVPYMFMRTPRLTDFKRIFRSLKYELTGFTPLLYLSIFLFYVSSGLFNTSFVPSLQSKGFSNMLVFSVTAVAMFFQAVSFKYAGRLVEKRSPLKAATAGLLLRLVCYGFIGIAIYMSSGLPFLFSTLILYTLAAGLAYAIYYTASNTAVFHTLGEHHQGSSLGVYSAMVGFATVLGAFVSGFMSSLFGFQTTFITAAVCLMFSALLVKRLTMHAPSTAL
jgi:MFS family permease